MVIDLIRSKKLRSPIRHIWAGEKPGLLFSTQDNSLSSYLSRGICQSFQGNEPLRDTKLSERPQLLVRIRLFAVKAIACRLAHRGASVFRILEE
jgi:hypothetical protein